MKHVCHEVGKKHVPCLLDMYRLNIGLAEIFGKGMGAFYFNPKDHFTVVCLVTWPFNGSEAGVDLVLIQTSLFCYVNAPS